jgi:F0F1-type ATP synthase assembly protein I
LESNRNGNNRNGNKGRSAVGLALSLGFGIAVPLALFIVGGIWLDGVLNTKPLFLLLGILLGLIDAGYTFWKLVNLSNR